MGILFLNRHSCFSGHFVQFLISADFSGFHLVILAIHLWGLSLVLGDDVLRNRCHQREYDKSYSTLMTAPGDRTSCAYMKSLKKCLAFRVAVSEHQGINWRYRLLLYNMMPNWFHAAQKINSSVWSWDNWRNERCHSILLERRIWAIQGNGNACSLRSINLYNDRVEQTKYYIRVYPLGVIRTKWKL